MTVDPHYHDMFGDLDVSPDPFTGMNWKSKRTKDQWSDLLPRMQRLRSLAEWKSVAWEETDRQIALVNINHNNMEQWLNRVGAKGLHTRTLRYVEPYDGFAHAHQTTTPDDPNRMCFTAIAENADVLDTAEEAYNEFDKHEKHDTLGEFLNFPECCRDAFVDRWLDRDIKDPMYELACASSSAERVEMNEETDFIHLDDPSPWVNPMWRYFQMSFITHIPCSLDCEKSEHVAYKRGEIMRDEDPEAAKALKTWLDAPFTWSGHNGIAHIRNEAVAAQTQTSSYFQEKTIRWKDEHAPGGKVPGQGENFSGMTP